MALSTRQVLRKLKKHQEIAQKNVLTFAPYHYRIFVERKRLSPAHVEDVNELAEGEGFFFFQASHGTLFFGREAHFQPSVFEAQQDIDDGLGL